jgi:hypothetical protein
MDAKPSGDLQVIAVRDAIVNDLKAQCGSLLVDSAGSAPSDEAGHSDLGLHGREVGRHAGAEQGSSGRTLLGHPEHEPAATVAVERTCGSQYRVRVDGMARDEGRIEVGIGHIKGGKEQPGPLDGDSTLARPAGNMKAPARPETHIDGFDLFVLTHREGNL